MAAQRSRNVRRRGSERAGPGRMFALILSVLSAGAAGAQTNPVRESVPPVRDFYAKYEDCGGLIIRSAPIVDDLALTLAAR